MQNVFISGATGGLGHALVRSFLAKGYRVLATGRNRLALSEALNHPQLTFVACDLSNREETSGLCRTLEAHEIDIIINAAATDCGVAPIETIPLAAWETNFCTGLFAAVQLNNAVIPHMKKAGAGCIINVTSAAGFQPLAWLAPYSANKAAMHSYTKSLSLELKKHGIRANSLGILADTSLYRSHKAQKAAGGYYNQYQSHAREMPAPDDNVEPFLFLASPAASHITGQYLECMGFI